MAYANSEWNLNNLPVVPSSILKQIDIDISGKVPVFKDCLMPVPVPPIPPLGNLLLIYIIVYRYVFYVTSLLFEKESYWVKI